MRGTSVLFVVLAVAVAGCSGANKPQAASPSSDVAQGTREARAHA